jgi:hypothetical protein
MHKRLLKAGLACAAAALLGGSSLMALADDDGDGGKDHGRPKFFVSAELIGFQEVPAVSTTAKGRFWAWVDTKANTITFKLTYDALEGDVTQAHVHFGQKSVNGGISFFLCTNLTPAPAGPLPPPCPVGPAEVTGVITPDHIIGPTGQGIEATSFAEIAAALRNGTAYANVHSSRWPAGEVRGQLR